MYVLTEFSTIKVNLKVNQSTYFLTSLPLLSAIHFIPLMWV